MKLKMAIAIILIFCISASLCACGANSRTSSKIAYKGNETFEDALKKFSLNSAAIVFMDGENKNKNLCYSPASLYVAFALAATGAASQTQAEMLAALGLAGKDAEYISGQIDAFVNGIYFENRYGAAKIANSIWLKEGAKVSGAFEENAANNFHSQVFSVNFENIPATPDMMKTWVEENTKHLISPTFDYSDPDLIFMYIINTLYFKDSWRDAFDARGTKPGPFHAAENRDVECEFMNKNIREHPYFAGDGFTASSIEFWNGGKMAFVLPDENTDIYDLLSSPAKLYCIFDQDNAKTGDVYFKIPKFKTQSSLDLIKTLKGLGVSDAFNAEKADFLGITEEQIYISKIGQDTYIKIDEIGAEAAAMAQIVERAGGMPQQSEKINMVLDRPFMYFITDRNGAILFAGAVFDPAK